MDSLPDIDQISLDHLRTIFDSWPHAVFVLNAQAVFIYQNDRDRAVFGDITGKTAAEISDSKAETENWADAHRRVLAGETVTMIITNEAGQGDARDAEVTLSPIGGTEHPIGILGITINRTADWQVVRTRAQAAQEAVAARARLKRLTESVPGAIFEFQIDGKGQRKFTYANSGMGALLGTTTEAMIADPDQAWRHDHPEDREMLNNALQHSFTSLMPVNLTHRINHPTLGLRWHRVHAVPSRRDDGGVVWHGCVFDVTEERLHVEELRAARNRMAKLSLIDTLTDLPNRRAFENEFLRRKSNPTLRNLATSVLRLDLDHFKSVNDTLGHAAGDALLTHVAACIGCVMSDDDFAARLGGDEFVVLLGPAKTLEAAQQLVTALHDKFGLPFTHKGRHCRFNASFGVAATDTLPDELEDLLSPADAALLQAKARGRGRTEVFTPTLQTKIANRTRRMKEIKLDLDRGAFVPFFQPQIDAATGRLTGFEVLARWQHPTEGILVPESFIGIATEMHVVQDIDQAMFSQALKVLGDVQAEGLQVPKLSFNVSAARVHDPAILRAVAGLQTGGTEIAFELLESILIEDETAQFADHVRRLKEANIRIEVDDFGSGRASIIGILNIQPSTLKLDKRLVQPMLGSRKAHNILRAMIDIGRTLDVAITAEGVETMDHAVALRDLGCQTLQGYAFGRPMPAADLRGYLANAAPIAPRLKVVQ